MGKKKKATPATATNEGAVVTAPNEGEAMVDVTPPTMGEVTEGGEATHDANDERDPAFAAALAEDAAMGGSVEAEMMAKGDAVANATEVLDTTKAGGETKEGLALVRKSSIERPCKRVWAIAEAHPTLGRKAILEKCLSEGIAFYTARTQYQQWAALNKEVKRREAEKAATATANAA